MPQDHLADDLDGNAGSGGIGGRVTAEIVWPEGNADHLTGLGHDHPSCFMGNWKNSILAGLASLSGIFPESVGNFLGDENNLSFSAAFGLDIAESSGADLTVVRLFALLHDSCRQDDGADLEHGPRAAEMLDRIVPTVFAIDPGRFDVLKEAIRLHTSNQTTNDPTMGTYWDADRLDIGRVGMTPSAQYMTTEAGKYMATEGAKH